MLPSLMGPQPLVSTSEASGRASGRASATGSGFGTGAAKETARRERATMRLKKRIVCGVCVRRKT